MALYVRQLKLGPMENFVYLVGAKAARETAIVDPAWDVAAGLRAAEEDGRAITHALLSHHHFDHVNGLAEVLAQGGIRVFAHRADVPGLAPELRREVTPLDAGDAVEVGPMRIAALHTPGHTPGSTCWHAGEGLFAGDTVFAATEIRGVRDHPGRPDLGIVEAMLYGHKFARAQVSRSEPQASEDQKEGAAASADAPAGWKKVPIFELERRIAVKRRSHYA